MPDDLLPLYYECHITLRPVDEELAALLSPTFGFKISKIDGDEALGDRVWLYCTKSSRSRQNLYIDMVSMCAGIEAGGAVWIRRKIESIIIDERRNISNMPNSPNIMQ